jgi:hypothetical protein
MIAAFAMDRTKDLITPASEGFFAKSACPAHWKIVLKD